MMADVSPAHKELQNRMLAVFQTGYEAALALLGEAFETGKKEGKNDAAKELRDKMAGVLNETLMEPDENQEGKRAPRGTVRPTIIACLEAYPEGLTTADVATSTSLNENSVRGALNAMLGEKLVSKKDGRWLLKK